MQFNEIVKADCIFRLKESNELACLQGHGADDCVPQTVIFIALTPLHQQNGFFVDLEPGQDVCVDSVADIWFPPSGGGLGLCVCLNL